MLKVKGQSQTSGAQPSILGARLCRMQQRAKKGHYQSQVFVCVSSYRADAVDRLLIWNVQGPWVGLLICKMKKGERNKHCPNTGVWGGAFIGRGPFDGV